MVAAVKFVTRTLLTAGWLIVPLAALITKASADETATSERSWTGETMGSLYIVRLADVHLSEVKLEVVQKEVDQQLEEVNRQMSNYKKDSELSRFNESPANVPFKISREFARMVRLSQQINRASDGVFDPTLGPLINLWGFGPTGQRTSAPAPALIEKTLKNTGIRHLGISDKDELIKNIPGLHLDLGGISKGFGVDEMARVLSKHGLTNFFVAISGEVYARGRGPTGVGWRIGIDEPIFGILPAEEVKVVVALKDCAISTSGNYRKFYRDEKGKVYCHIIDPRTGQTVMHDLGCVSVVAPTCTQADALATATYVLGPEKGLQFIDRQTNASAFFIVREPSGGFRRFASKRFPPHEIRAAQ